MLQVFSVVTKINNISFSYFKQRHTFLFYFIFLNKMTSIYRIKNKFY